MLGVFHLLFLFLFFSLIFDSLVRVIKKWVKKLLTVLYLTFSPSLSFVLVETSSTHCTTSSRRFLLYNTRLGLLASKQPFPGIYIRGKYREMFLRAFQAWQGWLDRWDCCNSLSFLLSSFLFLFTCFCCFEGFCLD